MLIFMLDHLAVSTSSTGPNREPLDLSAISILITGRIDIARSAPSDGPISTCITSLITLDFGLARARLCCLTLTFPISRNQFIWVLDDFSRSPLPAIAPIVDSSTPWKQVVVEVTPETNPFRILLRVIP